MQTSNVKSCPHAGHSQAIRTSNGKTVLLCDQCHVKVMLIISSKRVMDDFYIRQLPLEHQYKIRRERAEMYALSTVGGR